MLLMMMIMMTMMMMFMVMMMIIIIIIITIIILYNIYNQQVQTDRTIPNNKPDIIIRDNEKGTCMLIDVAISGDRNVIKK
jgi:biopolymer transport protein ExbB/TolQ